MMKKIAIAVVAVAAGLLVLGATGVGRKVCSYARVGWNKVGSELDAQIPPEVEIARLRDELNRTGPTIKKSLGEMAKEMVAIEDLKGDIKNHQATLDQQRKAIALMRKELDSKDEKIVLNDKEFPRYRIEEKLASDFETYKRSEGTLKQKQNLLEKREQALEASREQLKAMEAMKSQLEIELAGLEAEVKAMRVAEAKNPRNFDDGKLGEVKEGVANLRNKIRTKVQTDKLVQEYVSDPGVEVNKKVKNQDVLKEVDAYFAKPKDDKAVVEKK